MSDESRLDIVRQVNESRLITSNRSAGLVARGRIEATATYGTKALIGTPFKAEFCDPDAEYADEIYDGMYWVYGPERNISKGVECFGKAADKGNWTGCYNLGVMFQNGDGEKQDASAAAWFYAEAAKNGHAKAQFNFGLMWHHGGFAWGHHGEIIARPDYRLAAGWYAAAAQGGLNLARKESLFNVRRLLEIDPAAPYDHQDEIMNSWYSMRNSLSAAHFNLGICHEMGLGVPQDYVLAFWWLHLAAEATPTEPRGSVFFPERGQTEYDVLFDSSDDRSFGVDVTIARAARARVHARMSPAQVSEAILLWEGPGRWGTSKIMYSLKCSLQELRTRKNGEVDDGGIAE